MDWCPQVICLCQLTEAPVFHGKKEDFPAENCLLVQEIGAEEVLVYSRKKQEEMRNINVEQRLLFM